MCGTADPAPGLSDVPAIETYRGTVHPSDCDVLGHMNVSRYFVACGDAGFSIQTHLGLGRSNIVGGERLSLAVVRAECDFRAEVLAGSVLVCTTSIPTVGRKSLVLRHTLSELEDGTVVFVADFRCALLDLSTRRAREIPPAMRERAALFAPEP